MREHFFVAEERSLFDGHRFGDGGGERLGAQAQFPHQNSGVAEAEAAHHGGKAACHQLELGRRQRETGTAAQETSQKGEIFLRHRGTP